MLYARLDWWRGGPGRRVPFLRLPALGCSAGPATSSAASHGLGDDDPNDGHPPERNAERHDGGRVVLRTAREPHPARDADQASFRLRAERFQKIELFEAERYGRVLALDGVYQTSEAEEYFYHEMLVHPAMTSAPRIAARSVIGGGDGGTAREVLKHPEVEQCVMVEIDARVVERARCT